MGILKKLMCFVLCAVMMLSVLSVAAFAETDNGDISTYTDGDGATLTISSGVAKCNVKYTASSSINKIVVVLKLQKYSSSTWTDYYYTSATLKSNSVNLTKYIDVTSGKYRVYATVTTYIDSTAQATKNYTSTTVSC